MLEWNRNRLQIMKPNNCTMASFVFGGLSVDTGHNNVSLCQPIIIIIIFVDSFFLSILMVDFVQFKLSNAWRPVSAIKVNNNTMRYCVFDVCSLYSIETNAIIIIKMVYPLSRMYDVWCTQLHHPIIITEKRRWMNEWMVFATSGVCSVQCNCWK